MQITNDRPVNIYQWSNTMYTIRFFTVYHSPISINFTRNKILERILYFQVRFFITVKKNYRAVAYHNWSHGFHVANSIYSILKASPGIFKPIEVRICYHMACMKTLCNNAKLFNCIKNIINQC